MRENCLVRRDNIPPDCLSQFTPSSLFSSIKVHQVWSLLISRWTLCPLRAPFLPLSSLSFISPPPLKDTHVSLCIFSGHYLYPAELYVLCLPSPYTPLSLLPISIPLSSFSPTTLISLSSSLFFFSLAPPPPSSVLFPSSTFPV